ncbi:MAG: Nif3-like dinuclear metal center hexameric protein [Syntrophomonas sp.]
MSARIKDIVKIVENYFPLHLAAKWDNVGLQIGSLQNPVNKVVIALDLDKEVLQYAVSQKAELIITHHPLFFSGVKSIDYSDFQGSMVKEIIEAGITVYAAHTNLDAGERGLNQILAERIGLQDIKPLDNGYSEALYKLVVYVPVSHEDAVRQAILLAGAGHIGMYRDCSFKVRGTGSFRPLEGSQPFIGQEGILEEVEESRLETVVPKSKLEVVLQKMRQAHPYEEVAYDLYLLARKGPVFSMGRMGKLAAKMDLKDFCTDIKNGLGLKYLRVAGDLDKPVAKIAVVSGAGASFIGKARRQGCDAILTGDLKYHEAKDAVESGIAVIDAGHQGTEQIVSSYLNELLAGEVDKIGLEVTIMSMLNREYIITL